MAPLSQKWLIPALLLLLLATGLFLRAYALGVQSFWLDEAISTNAAIAILEKGAPVFDSGFLYSQYLLNTYLIAFSMALFGTTAEWAARAPSVLFGGLSIILAYFFGKAFSGGSRKMGLLLALLVSFFTLEIAWSRQARMYLKQASSLALFKEVFN